MEDDVCEEYNSSLSDLSCNSKPLINMLTMLAEDNVKNAPKIVQVIESHLQKVSPEVKLPVLYLIDSIIKNVGGPYQQLFTQNIVSNFCSVFEKVEEKTRIQLFKLRQTWNDVFPSKKLYAIDVRVKSIDPAWPVTAQPNIHVNPKFLENKPAAPPNPEAAAEAQAEVRRQLLEKQQELLRLQQQRLELEKLQIQTQLEKQKLNEISRVAQPSTQIHHPVRPQLLPVFNQARSPDPNLARRDPRATARDPRVQRNVLGSPFSGDLAYSNRASLPRDVLVPVVPNKPNISSNAAPSIFVNSCTAAPTVSSSTTTASITTNSNFSGSEPDIICLTDVSSPKTTEPSKKSHIPSANDSNNKDKKSSPPKQNSQTTHAKSSPKKNSLTSNDKNADVPLSSKIKKDDSSKVSPKKSQKDKKDVKNDKQSKSPEGARETNLNSKNLASPKKKSRETSLHDKDGRQGSKDKKTHPAKEETCSMSSKKKSRKSEKNTLKNNKNQPEKTRSVDENKQESGDVDLRVEGKFHEVPSLHEDLNRGKKNSPDIDENDDEPVRKKAKDEPAKVDSLFGEEDKDYRIPQTADVDSRPHQKNWAQYKASHPDEFKSPSRPTRDIMAMDTDPFPNDPDFRSRGKFQFKNFHGLPTRESGFDRLGRPLLSRMKSFPRWRHINSQYDYDPNAQHQMHIMLSNREAIIRQAEEQYRTGRITSLQHQEFLADLKRLNEFQNHPRMPLRERWMNFRRNMEMNDPIFYGPTSSRGSMRGNDLPGEPVFIDGDLRRIYFIGGKAIVFVAGGEAREVCFQGNPIDVFLDDMKLFSLEFNRTKDFDFNGSKHHLRFGAPSREVYIDGRPYKAQFGGNPIRVFISGKAHQLRLSGPQPSVEIGTIPLNDFVEKHSRPGPVEIDFRSGGNSIDIDMRDALKRADDNCPPEGHGYLNLRDIDMRVVNPRTRLELEGEIGHLSPMHLSPGRNTPPRIPDENLGPGRPPLCPWEESNRREEHLHPGYRNLPPENEARWNSPSRDFGQEMDWQPTGQMEWEQHKDNSDQQFGNYPSGHDSNNWNGPPTSQDGNREDWRVRGRGSFHPTKGSPQRYDDYQYPGNANIPMQRKAPFNLPYHGQGSRMPYRMPNTHGNGFAGDPRAHGPRHPRPAVGRYPQQPSVPLPPVDPRDEAMRIPEKKPDESVVSTSQPASVETAAPNLDINSLFAKLVSVGLIQSESSEPPPQEKPATSAVEEESQNVKAQEISKMPAIELSAESLKGHYPEIAVAMYKGIQCASCGLRFSEVQNEKYRQHLDWHFRSNRREKDGAKKAFSRKWYYDVEDWTQFEEVEDLEDRAQSFFELQAAEEQFAPVVKPAMASVPTTKDETEHCAVCGEQFEQIWVEEEEEWHLKDAVRIEDKTYHPLCFEDFKKASEAPETPVEMTEEKSFDETKTEPKSEETEDAKVEEMESGEGEVETKATEEVPSPDEATEENKETETEEVLPEEEKADVTEMVAESEVKEEEKEEVVPEEPSPPEEEIIGLISETDPPSEDEMPKVVSDMVVMQSGSIIMKVKAESIAQPVTSTPPPSANDDNSDSAQKTDVETDTEDELLLPPPDPRFTVLPPVQRGQELSGLCSIM